MTAGSNEELLSRRQAQFAKAAIVNFRRTRRFPICQWGCAYEGRAPLLR